MIKLLTTLVALSTLTAAAVPAQADDTAVIQSSESTTVVTGDGNISTQVSEQTVRQRRQGRNQGDNAVVQDSDQLTDIYGRNNDSYQQTTQEVEQESRTTRTYRY